MPFLAELNYNEKASKMYLSDAFSSVVVKDIARRNNIRDIDLLERIIRHVQHGMHVLCFLPVSILQGLENIVFIELFRRGYDVHVGKVGGEEMDFVANRQNEKIYVQVSYMLASESTIEREFGVYNLVRDNWPKYVVSMDELDISRDGIKHMNITDFLLADDWA